MNGKPSGSGIYLVKRCGEGAFPFSTQMYSSTVLGRHCLEPSPWLIHFGLMSIRLNLDLLNYTCLRLKAPCGLIHKGIACAGGVFGCEIPTHIFHLHTLA
jgi:hypothetical protein